MDKDISNSLDADVQRYEQQQCQQEINDLLDEIHADMQRYEQQQKPEDFDPYELMYMNAYVVPVASPLSPGIHHFTLLPL